MQVISYLLPTYTIVRDDIRGCQNSGVPKECPAATVRELWSMSKKIQRYLKKGKLVIRFPVFLIYGEDDELVPSALLEE